jgi:hypothetical protein
MQAPTYQLHTGYGETSREILIEPTVLVEKVEKPTIVKETIVPLEKIEVQPVIHREREQLEVREVVQPLRERDVAATHVRHATLPAEVRAEVRESDSAFQTSYREATTRHIPEVHTEAVQREVVNRAPIVEEHVHKKIVEEVQPVLYRETVTPVLIEETKPIYEKYVEMPRIVEEIKPMVDLGTRYTELPTAQMSNLSISGETYQTGLPYATQTYQTGGLPYATHTYQTGGFSHGQPVQREVTVTKEVYVEPVPHHLHGTTHHPESEHHHAYLPETFHHHTHLPETHQHGTTYTTGSQLPKETIITQETYVEPARATSQPYTESKRIV